MLLMILALATAPLDCSSPSSVAEVGTPIIEAWRSGRTEEAKAKVDALITACPDPVIEGDYANGPFKRHLTFLIIPAAPLEPPRTIMLTTSPATQLLGVSNSYALDEYTCDRHVTLDWIKSPTQPTYNEVRERILAHLEVSIDGVSASFGPADAVCAFAAYLAPGFEAN
jgi:hypothetical protein